MEVEQQIIFGAFRLVAKGVGQLGRQILEEVVSAGICGAVDTNAVREGSP